MAETHAVVPGRFLPLHQGHVSLLRSALQLADKLWVVLLDPTADDRRAGWIGEMFPDARIATSLDALPRLTGADRVIGSHDGIPALAKELGAQHTVIDPERFALPINSATLRESPARNWADLAAPVQRSLRKRLTLIGPESTGKSYLSRLLAERYGGPVVPEYGRPFETYRPEGDYTEAELFEIARVHVAHRDALATLAGPVLFEDTDPLLTAVWAEMLLGRSLPELEADIALPDHYLLLDPDVPFEEDPIRYYGDPARRQQFFDLIVAKLKAHGASYTLLKGSYSDREAQAHEVVQTLQDSIRL